MFNESTSQNNTTKIWLYVAIGAAILIIALVIVGIANRKYTRSVNQLDNNKGAPSQPVTADADERKIVQPARADYPARLALEPRSLSVSAGEEAEIAVTVDTFGKNTVVGSVLLTWDADMLDLIDTDTKGSVYPMRVVKKESAGSLEIVRGVPGDADSDDSDDGFTGKGTIAVITFKTLKAGNAVISFDKQKSMVIMDDGKGSKMRTEFGEAKIETK